MTVSVDTSGLLALAGRFARNAATVEPKAAAIIAKGAHDIVRLAQQLVAANSVETGHLEHSIGVTFEDNGLTAVVGPTVDYARYVEFGTRDMDAEPFMRPAADAVLPGVNAALLHLLRRAAG